MRSDVEAPRKLVQAAVRELGDVNLRAARLRRCGRFFPLRHFARLVAPQIELAVDEEEKAVFQGEDEGATVVFEEGKRCAKSEKGHDEGRGEVDRKDAIQDVTNPRPAREVDELLEGEGAKDLVLDLDELRNLELHGLIIQGFVALFELFQG